VLGIADNKWFTRGGVAAANIQILDSPRLKYLEFGPANLKELAAARAVGEVRLFRTKCHPAVASSMLLGRQIFR
jgi:hypothetical protein